MTDLVPLLHEGADELEAKLLLSAEDDDPARGALERVATALDVSTAALALTAVGAHASTTGASAAAPKLTLVSLAKWLGVGLGAGVMVSGGANLVAVASHTTAPETSSAVMATSPPRPSARRGVSARAPQSEPATTATSVANLAAPDLAGAAAPDLAGAAAPTVTSAATSADAPTARPHALVAEGAAASPTAALPLPPPSSSAAFAPLEGETKPEPTPTAEVVTATTLREETRALDAVRARTAAKRWGEALVELGRYEARWPHGALWAEASLLRVEALLGAGRRAEAEHEAKSLGRRAPESGYTHRARALLDGSAVENTR
jgi:hypothetical protein